MTEEISSRRRVEAPAFGWDVGPYPSPAPRTLPAARLSVNERTTYRWSFAEDVLGCREAGIEALGIWRPKLAEFGEERGVELVREMGLSVSSLSWIGGFTGAHGLSFDEALADAREAVLVAGELNAECLVVAGGAQGGHISSHARRLLVTALQRLGDLAAEHGVVLAVQPMHPRFAARWTFLTGIDQTLDVLSRCDHRHVGMAFDVFHLWQEPRLLQRIPAIAPHVATVQLSDSRSPRSDHDRRPFGEGEIPLAEITRAFAHADYEGFFEVEIWSEETWTSDYDALLRNCRTRFEDLCRGW